MPHDMAATVSPPERPRRLRRFSRFFTRTLTVAAVAVGTVILLAALWFGLHALLLIFAGIVLSIALRGLSDAITRSTGLAPRWALASVVVVLLAVFGFGAWFLAPSVGEQMRELFDALPRAFDKLRERVAGTAWAPMLLTDEKGKAVEWSALPSAFGHLGKGFALTLGALGDVIVVLFLAVFLALDAHRYREGLMRFVPPRWHERVDRYLHEAKENLRRWFLGRLTDMAFVGTFTYLGLWLLDVPLALPLALVTALLGFIPFFGPIAATVPAALLGLTVGPATAGWVVALYLAVQLTEGNIVTPLIEQRVVSIPPAVTISAVLLLGVWCGPLGMALAVPLTLIVWLLVRHLYLEDTLGQPPVSPAAPP